MWLCRSACHHAPHAIIAGWIAEQRRRRKNARLDPWRRPSDYRFTEVEQRRHRIFDALFKTLERHGFKAKLGDRYEVYLEIEGERVDFDLRERKKQVRRPLTEEEKRSPYAPARGFVQEMQLTGELIFALKTHLVDGAKHEWRDGEQTLETQLPDIVSLILLAGPILKERRRQYEEAEARRRGRALPLQGARAAQDRRQPVAALCRDCRVLARS
jgi:hypothetical protein